MLPKRRLRETRSTAITSKNTIMIINVTNVTVISLRSRAPEKEEHQVPQDMETQGTTREPGKGCPSRPLGLDMTKSIDILDTFLLSGLMNSQSRYFLELEAPFCILVLIRRGIASPTKVCPFVILGQSLKEDMNGREESISVTGQTSLKDFVILRFMCLQERVGFCLVFHEMKGRSSRCNVGVWLRDHCWSSDQSRDYFSLLTQRVQGIKVSSKVRRIQKERDVVLLSDLISSLFNTLWFPSRRTKVRPPVLRSYICWSSIIRNLFYRMISGDSESKTRFLVGNEVSSFSDFPFIREINVSPLPWMVTSCFILRESWLCRSNLLSVYCVSGFAVSILCVWSLLSWFLVSSQDKCLEISREILSRDNSVKGIRMFKEPANTLRRRFQRDWETKSIGLSNKRDWTIRMSQEWKRKIVPGFRKQSSRSV